MLSYQHHYHAGNAADVHKHAVLAWILAYLIRKPKPLSYIETHAGRGRYDLSDSAALKTGEAAQGVRRLEPALPNDHPWRRCLRETRAAHGPDAYPGSPLLAALGLRSCDSLHLAELHPGEHAGLRAALAFSRARIHHVDGFQMARALCPPTPRRGLMFVDPSYEVKAEYDRLPGQLAGIARTWNVGILMLWYPVLPSAAHAPMLDTLGAAFPGAHRHEVAFPAARAGHRMTGSGLFVVNPPYGLAEETRRLSRHLAAGR